MTVLAPNGRPTTNRCVAFKCGVEIPIPTMFCQRHWPNVPQHLRQAWNREVKWLDRHKSPPDQHSMALMSVLINRELQHRIRVDPKARREFEEFVEAQMAAQRAQQAGLVGPDGKPFGQAQAPASHVASPGQR